MRSRPAILRTALALTVFALAASGARADEIVTKDGVRYSGRITKEDGTHWTIDTEELGPTRIPKADVTSVQRATAPAPAAAKDASGKPAAQKPPATQDAGTPPVGGDAATPADAEKDAEAAKEAEKKAAEEKAAAEALDAAERMRIRKSSSIKRTTSPNKAPGATGAPAAAAGAAAAVTEKPAEKAVAKAEEERSALGGAQLAATPAGTTVLVFEPPRPVDFAPTGIALGRRTIARMDLAGRGTARLKVAAGAAEETWTVRLGDVQRHIVVKSPTDRVRLLEGLETGDWLRFRQEDGTFAQGRLTELSAQVAKLGVTQPDGSVVVAQVDLKSAVQLDGLAKSTSTTRMLQDIMLHDPVAITLWPDGREIVGRCADNTGNVIKVDTNGDGNPDESVAIDGPVADVRRVAAMWRELVRDFGPTTAVKVRCFEDYKDARVEREWTGMVAASTAYALSVATEDGAAVVPYENVLKVERISSVHAEKPRLLEVHTLHLPVLPGDSCETGVRADAAKGITVLTDGQFVTHVYVQSPWEDSVCGVRLGNKLEDVLATSDLRFSTEVFPKGDKLSSKLFERELISESVDGLRVTVYADKHARVHLIEIVRK